MQVDQNREDYGQSRKLSGGGKGIAPTAAAPSDHAFKHTTRYFGNGSKMCDYCMRGQSQHNERTEHSAENRKQTPDVASLPSSRPMTLRQQLVDIFKLYDRELTDFDYAQIGRILTVCQEISREALTKGITDIRDAYIDGGPMGGSYVFTEEQRALLDEHLAELTQKPPQPQGAEK